ncbi:MULTISPECIES: PACE efflux transporter [unclassified Pseudoalteromonas]|uniref:PACE efflux transporter n=1 Tax=unclassified Pseudoalteromonas TaxID=194690 RepID=UPI0018CD8191|nr:MULTISPECIES: PACE efflux transporter [unclassified Pseudoalteromonas]MBH0040092.1 PACE efflux transporter [Pseudoalteromonas sp. SWN166]MBH0041934.1 PACE efflux transporter [Pseudoalteromonas sp. SWXJZ10B]MBH0074546.1 PACE efflux transporter [Pseudoalteromonas sp. SWYJ118]
MTEKMGATERVFQAVLFEILAVSLSILGLALFTDHAIGALSGTMVIVATIAMCWNFIFNWCFDKVATGAKEQRSVLFRIFHVLLFQGGLLVFTIPVMAIILKVGLWEALIMDIGVTFFITLYAFTFNLVYDHTRAYIFHSKNAAC